MTSYHKNTARSLLEEPKFYFYDHVNAEEDGAKLENLVACALLKELNLIEDTKGIKTSLHYLRTKDGKEIDFLICIEGRVELMLEAKLSDETPSANFHHFAKFLPQAKKFK